MLIERYENSLFQTRVLQNQFIIRSGLTNARGSLHIMAFLPRTGRQIDVQHLVEINSHQ